MKNHEVAYYTVLLAELLATISARSSNVHSEADVEIRWNYRTVDTPDGARCLMLPYFSVNFVPTPKLLTTTTQE
jgi:hypothetical protein